MTAYPEQKPDLKSSAPSVEEGLDADSSSETHQTDPFARADRHPDADELAALPRPQIEAPAATRPVGGSPVFAEPAADAGGEIDLDRFSNELRAQFAASRAYRHPDSSRSFADGQPRFFGSGLSARGNLARGAPLRSSPSPMRGAPEFRAPRDRLLHRLMVPTALAAAAVLVAGAVGIWVFAAPAEPPMEIPAAAVTGATGAETPATAQPPDRVSSVAQGVSEPVVTIEPLRRQSELDLSVPAAPAEPEIAEQNPAPAVTGSVSRAAQSPKPAIAKGGKNTIQFGPTGSDLEPARGAPPPPPVGETLLPPEVRALVPPQLPTAARRDDVRPLAFAATPEPTGFGTESAPDDPVPHRAEPLAETEMPAPSAEHAAPTAAPEERSTTVARARTHVNMRSGPDNKHPIIAVVPANGALEVISCDYWCEVVFKGRRGWIYKDFVIRSG